MRNITDPQQIRSVAVFRALCLGDLLCCVPALRALKAWLPRAQITFIGLPWSRAFAGRFSRYLDGFIEFPGFPGLPESVADVRLLPAFLRGVQEKHFDLALQMHGNGRVTNPLAELFGACVTAGFFAEGAYFPPDGWPVPYPDHLHEILRCLTLVGSIGAQALDPALEFPLTPADEEEFRELPGSRPLDNGSYIVVHPGSRSRARRWSPEGFAVSCDALSGGKLTVAITGSAQEWDLAERIRVKMKSRGVNLAGKTTLGSLAVLLRGSRLLIANDTGISHLACALKVPSVIVFTASDPRRWAPLDTVLHKTVFHESPCRPCEFPVCPIGHPCSRNIDPEQVIRAGKELLAGSLLAPAA
ncbi:MAG: glycosyltransferase family 9 protein [Deltaproteobacteria bacterium]